MAHQIFTEVPVPEVDSTWSYELRVPGVLSAVRFAFFRYSPIFIIIKYTPKSWRLFPDNANSRQKFQPHPAEGTLLSYSPGIQPMAVIAQVSTYVKQGISLAYHSDPVTKNLTHVTHSPNIINIFRSAS